ncbi:hypothetical protein D3C76_1526220 [compost metagenome]
MASPTIVGVPANVINCDNRPWEGLRVRMFDPAQVELGDDVNLHWAMYQGFVSEEPVEESIGDFPGRIENQNEIDAGLFLNVPFSPNIEPVELGRVRIYWTVTRSGIVYGRSETVEFFYSVVQGSSTCIP